VVGEDAPRHMFALESEPRELLSNTNHL